MSTPGTRMRLQPPSPSSVATSFPHRDVSPGGWSIVGARETRDLWIGGRALPIMLGVALFFSILTYLLATDKELSLLGQKDMMNLTVQISIAIGALLTLLSAADALSGERERGTLESLLLTPQSRYSIVGGKLVASLTLWLGAYLTSVPYLWILGTGTDLFPAAAALSFVVGSLLALSLAGLGIAVSIRSRTNRAALGTSILIFLLLVAPTQLPATTRKGWLGDLIARANPVTAGAHFVDKILVSHHTWAQEASQLAAPAFAATLALVIAFALARRLSLDGGISQ